MPPNKKKPSPTKPTNTVLQDRFITHYFACGGVKYRAAEKAEVGYTIVKKWFKEDAEFLERLEEFRDRWIDGLTAALIQRGMTKSDNAAFFLLKSARPEMFDDNIRKLKWLRDNEMVDPDAIQRPSTIVFVREAGVHELPEVADEVEPAVEREH